MGKYDDAASQAMGDTLKEFADDIKQLQSIGGEGLAGLFPAPADQEAVKTLIAAVEKSTSKNELITAFQVFTAKASTNAVSVFKDSFQIAKKLVL